MWENLVGRSLPFLRWFYPRLQEAFPAQLGSVEVEDFYRAVNKIEPSFIRVDADQVTYNMHVILRFELEQEIITGAIALEDVPEAWNAKMKEYLGIDVPDDRRGVLQDVHWSGGGFGYFPTYSLGNVISLQIWEKVREALPDLDEQFERGEFAPLARVARARTSIATGVSSRHRKPATSGRLAAGRRAVPPLPQRQGRRAHRRGRLRSARIRRTRSLR